MKKYILWNIFFLNSLEFNWFDILSFFFCNVLLKNVLYSFRLFWEKKLPQIVCIKYNTLGIKGLMSPFHNIDFFDDIFLCC